MSYPLDISDDSDVSLRPKDWKNSIFSNSLLKLEISDSILAEIFIQSTFFF